MTYVSQMSLITAILRELEAQKPGARISQAQMNAIIGAADLIVLTMRKTTPPPALEKSLEICAAFTGLEAV